LSRPKRGEEFNKKLKAEKREKNPSDSKFGVQDQSMAGCPHCLGREGFVKSVKFFDEKKNNHLHKKCGVVKEAR